MSNSKIDKLNAMLEDGVIDNDLSIDFDDEEEALPLPEKKPKQRKKPEPQQPFISDTFSSLMQSMNANQTEEDEEPEEPEVEDRISTKDILSNIKVDLSSIEIVSGIPEHELLKNQKEVLGTSKVMQVVCCQSAYSADVSALKNQEIQNLNNANVDVYTFKRRLYKTIWDHIETTSVGKIDFNTWMKVTSYFDIETLLYGIYCMTFPYENKYPVRCPKGECKHSFDIIVNNNSLIETRGREEEIFSKINEVVSRVVNSKELLNHSHVHTTERVMLQESKIVVDIQIPSVYDYLEGILKKVQGKDEYAEEHAQSLGNAMFIKQMLIPDVEGFKKTGKLKFIPVSDTSKFTEIVAQLPYYDGIELSEKIDEFASKLLISYSIKGVSCPKCGYEFPSIPMEMESVLFTEIRLGRRD